MLVALFLWAQLGTRSEASQALPVPLDGLPGTEVERTFPNAPGWYSGDTHEHIQYCDLTLHPLDEIHARMEAENLNVANVLIWDFLDLEFTDFVCNVTGALDPLSGPERILQYGVETSQLSCARWGHLTGLNIGPDQARITRGLLAEGACEDMDGLGLGGDGSGVLNGPVAGHFFSAPGAVCGYAHTVWTIGAYHPLGYDWNGELLASGFTTDAAYMDTAQRLAVPDVPRLMGVGYPLSAVRAFLPLLGAMDAALGNVQFIETVVMGLDLPVNVTPAAHWNELYYKLLSAGVRVGLAGGTDRACLEFGTGGSADFVRTYVRAGESLTYDAWTKGLAAGRTSIAAGPGTYLHLSLGGAEVGSDVRLQRPDLHATARVQLQLAEGIDDCIELVVDGEVRDWRPVQRDRGGSVTVTFDVSFTQSSWVAARLCSQRAHTGAVYVIVDGQPVGSPHAAEYWMLWCDIVAKTTLEHPEISFFGRQRPDALALAAQARRAFKTLRDVHGFDPQWGVSRYGVSTASCRGPIAIGTTGPAHSGESLLLTCVNAPPLADGVLYLSRVPHLGGECEGDILSYVRTEPLALLGAFPARATRSGYAEVEIPLIPSEDALYAQFVWTNPPDCAGAACSGGTPTRSASDALSLLVDEPLLTSLAVTPTNPAIALGTSVQFTAMGTFSDGTTEDLTGAVAWSSSSPSVATVSNAPGSQGLATTAAVGSTTIAATDTSSGIGATVTLTVTPAVLVAIEVTPTNPAIALGTSQQFSALGIYSDGTTQDLTRALLWSSSDQSVARVSNAPGSQGLARSVSPGVTSIAASHLLLGISGATTLTVTPAVLRTLEVTPTDPSIALGTTQPFTAIGVFSDGTLQDVTGAVLWSSADESVASVSNEQGSAGLASSLSTGVTTITASAAALGISGASTLTVTPAVLVALEVTPIHPSIALGTSQQFTATGVYTDATTQDLTSAVTWSSSSPGVAAISNAPGSQGLAISVAPGVTSIAALHPKSGFGDKATLTVTPAVVVVLEVTPTDPSIPLGTVQQFTAIGVYSDATTQDLTGEVTWSSAVTAVAAVSNAPGSQGLATSVAQGVTTIGALEPASGVSGTTTLTITPAILVSLRVAPADSVLALGFFQQFTAFGTYTDASVRDLTDAVTWSSSNPGVAAISNAPGHRGVAITRAQGVTTIAALEPESGSRAETTLTVTPAELVAIGVTPAEPSIALGFGQQFRALGTYSDATTLDLTAVVTWSSSNTEVATVSNVPGSQGFATSGAAGVTTIAAIDPDSAIGGGTTLTVTPAILLAIEVLPPDSSLALGFSRQFTAIGTYSDATTLDLTAAVTWSSSRAKVAAVSNAPGSQGLATSLAQGVTTIAATDPKSSVSGATSLTVTPPILLALEVTPLDPTIGLGLSQAFTATGLYSDASEQDLTATVQWTSTDETVATVSNAPGSQGLATSLAVGTTIIAATDLASGISGTSTLTVKAVLLAIQVTPAHPAILAGRTKQFTATGSYNDGSTRDLTATVTWTSSNPAVATVSNTPGTNGLATGISGGFTTIRATDAESGITGATLLTVLARL